MAGRLDGKVAVVTGASKGIGAAIAIELAAEGAAVVVNYSTSPDGANRVVAQIKENGGKGVAIGGNVASRDDVKKLFDDTQRHFGKVNVLVNNAGIYRFENLEGITAEHFHEQFDVNVLGLLYATQEAVAHFGPNGGSVINISSVASTSAPPGTSVYSATKAAVNAITRSLAQELGPRKIRVNAINPGMVITEGTHTAGIAGSDWRKQTEQQTPLGRIGRPDDIGPAAVFFASDDSAWITGEMLYISGGLR